MGRAWDVGRIEFDDTAQAMVHAERAEQHALGGRESRAQGFDRSRIFDEIRLAKVRLAQHDVAESVTVAQAAVELAAPTSSILVCNPLLRFHGELTTRYPATRTLRRSASRCASM
ncbi:MAG: hypothetical protein ACRDRP_12385 [Pseudonocardiaceae bacterium]